MQAKIMGFGPVAVGTSAANILNSAVTSMAGPVGVTIGQPYFVVTRIRAINKTGLAGTISLFIGATGASAAGTEFAWSASPVAANGNVEWAGRKRMDSTQFLTGLATTTTTTLVIEGDIEIGIA